MVNYPQARYWILTIPGHAYTPYLPPCCSYIRGQLEVPESGFVHWQLVVHFKKKTRLRTVRLTFGDFHAEPTKSNNAEEYVWKEDTAVTGTRFELGSKPRSGLRGSTDWEQIRNSAREGRLDLIPADVYVRYYNALKRIAMDHLQPVPMERKVICYWGPTGVGKSRRAWLDASFEAYPKDPRTKFWDGYNGQKHVVIDEFRGAIDISHLLRWFDRYPCNVEVKGSSTVLSATCIWITSNLNPECWYPLLDSATLAALLRRIEIFEITENLFIDQTTD